MARGNRGVARYITEKSNSELESVKNNVSTTIFQMMLVINTYCELSAKRIEGQ